MQIDRPYGPSSVRLSSALFVFYSFPWIKSCQVLNSIVVLVVGNHSSWHLYGSLREMNVPFIGVRVPVAKNLDKPRR